MDFLTLVSPSKLNLYLAVLGRRPDGYHDLVTLFHRISFADTLVLRKNSAGFRLTCSHKELPTDERNLITKAYRVLQSKFPKLGGVSVRVTKKIPLGAGLGGGSGNAATFLLGMNRLYRLGLSEKELSALGKSLGADVPFFIQQVSQAVGFGRGDRLEVGPVTRKLWFVLVLSNQGLSTKEVYENLPHSRKAPSLTEAQRAVKLLARFLKEGKLDEAAEILKNDLEAPAFRLRPALKKIIDRLNGLGVKTARMSGSGSTIFAVFSSRQEAEKKARVLRRKLPSYKIATCHTF